MTGDDMNEDDEERSRSKSREEWDGAGEMGKVMVGSRAGNVGEGESADCCLVGDSGAAAVEEGSAMGWEAAGEAVPVDSP
jgi:hypothetical protein